MGAEDLWNYERCRERIASLRGRLGFPDLPHLGFLGLSLDLRSGTLTLEPSGTPAPGLRAGVFCILDGYSRAGEHPETFRLIPFHQLPGGHAYDAAFRKRAILPLTSWYSRDRPVFSRTMEFLGGVPIAYADRAWKLPALPRVPLYILIWDGSDEFPPSAALFFDASVTAHLETEAAAMLGELATRRIALLCNGRE